jgi:hypothetical protein
MVLTIDSSLTPAGYEYLDLSDGNVKGLNPPNGAIAALIGWRFGEIHWRDDAAPAPGDATIGQLLPEDGFIWYKRELTAIKFIGIGPPQRGVSVSYYSP